MEEQLRTLADRQGRDLDVLIQEAVRDYLVAAATNDLDAGEIAEAQLALTAELHGIPGWKDGRA